MQWTTVACGPGDYDWLLPAHGSIQASEVLTFRAGEYLVGVGFGDASSQTASEAILVK